VTREQQNECFLQWAGEHHLLLRKVTRSFAFGSDQDDLYQEMLVAVWQAIPAWRGDAKPSTFIYRVAHNYALTWMRTRRNYSRAVERFGREAAPSSVGSEFSDSLLDQLYAAIRELPELDRSLVVLSLDGLPYKEIAEILGLSETNVGARLTRARALLTDKLREQEQ
jgi:RNA polymerase sigma factor (sigma-70 family)